MQAKRNEGTGRAGGKRLFLVFPYSMRPTLKNLVLCLALAFATTAWADIAVSPLLVSLNGDPGTRVPFSFTVRGKNTGVVSLEAWDATQTESGFMQYSNEPTPDAVSTWLLLPEKRLTLGRGKPRIVNGYVDIPRKTAGEFVVAVMVQELTENRENANVALKVRYAVALKIKVGDPRKRQKVIVSDTDIFVKDGKQYLSAQFTNPGRFIVDFESEVRLRRSGRQFMQKITLEGQKPYQVTQLYPGSSVKLSGPIKTPLKAGEYQALIRTELNGDRQPMAKRNLTVSQDQGNAIEIEAQPFFSPGRVPVTVRSNLSSYTRLFLENPLDQRITMNFSSDLASHAGLVEYEFTPTTVTVEPGRKKLVILKQVHESKLNNQERTFNLVATENDGRQHNIELTTVEGSGR